MSYFMKQTPIHCMVGKNFWHNIGCIDINGKKILKCLKYDFFSWRRWKETMKRYLRKTFLLVFAWTLQNVLSDVHNEKGNKIDWCKNWKIMSYIKNIKLYQNTSNWLAFDYCVNTPKGEYCTESSKSKKKNPCQNTQQWILFKIQSFDLKNLIYLFKAHSTILLFFIE